MGHNVSEVTPRTWLGERAGLRHIARYGAEWYIGETARRFRRSNRNFACVSYYPCSPTIHRYYSSNRLYGPAIGLGINYDLVYTKEKSLLFVSPARVPTQADSRLLGNFNAAIFPLACGLIWGLAEKSGHRAGNSLLNGIPCSRIGKPWGMTILPMWPCGFLGCHREDAGRSGCSQDVITPYTNADWHR